MNILVTGASGPAGRSLLTQLHRRGLSVLGVDMAPQPRTDGLPVTAVPAASDPEFAGTEPTPLGLHPQLLLAGGLLGSLAAVVAAEEVRARRSA